MARCRWEIAGPQGQAVIEVYNGYHPPVYWQMNGLLSSFAASTPIDGVRRPGVRVTIRFIRMTQRVDGSSGTTTANYYWRTTPSARTLIGSLSLSFGVGAYGDTSLELTTPPAGRLMDVTDSLEVELSSAAVGAADLSLSIGFG